MSPVADIKKRSGKLTDAKTKITNSVIGINLKLKPSDSESTTNLGKCKVNSNTSKLKKIKSGGTRGM